MSKSGLGLISTPTYHHIGDISNAKDRLPGVFLTPEQQAVVDRETARRESMRLLVRRQVSEGKTEKESRQRSGVGEVQLSASSAKADHIRELLKESGATILLHRVKKASIRPIFDGEGYTITGYKATLKIQLSDKSEVSNSGAYTKQKFPEATTEELLAMAKANLFTWLKSAK